MPGTGLDQVSTPVNKMGSLPSGSSVMSGQETREQLEHWNSATAPIDICAWHSGGHSTPGQGEA